MKPSDGSDPGAALVAALSGPADLATHDDAARLIADGAPGPSIAAVLAATVDRHPLDIVALAEADAGPVAARRLDAIRWAMERDADAIALLGTKRRHGPDAPFPRVHPDDAAWMAGFAAANHGRPWAMAVLAACGDA